MIASSAPFGVLQQRSVYSAGRTIQQITMAIVRRAESSSSKRSATGEQHCFGAALSCTKRTHLGAEIGTEQVPEAESYQLGLILSIMIEVLTGSFSAASRKSRSAAAPCTWHIPN